MLLLFSQTKALLLASNSTGKVTRCINTFVERHPSVIKAQIKVKKGQTVKKGEVIAALGSSGKVSKPQLHFELRDSNGPLNPLKYLP